MTTRRILLTGGGAVVGFLLIVVFTLLLIPSREIEGAVSRLFVREGYAFSAARFGKAFPFGVAARGVSLAGGRGELLRFDRARARIALFPLLTGRVVVAFDATAGSGRLAGEYDLRKASGGHIEVRGVRLEDVPFFRTVTGTEAKGLLSLDLTLRGSGPAVTGELKLEVKGADLRGMKIGETLLPDAGYETVRGLIRLGGRRAVIESFTLQGAELYTRLKGDFPLATPIGAAPLNLTLELMPKPAFLDRQQLVFALLAKYLVTPGHYQLPVRGTLAKPLLQ